MLSESLQSAFNNASVYRLLSIFDLGWTFWVIKLIFMMVLWHMLKVELYCDSLGTHLMQIYSGLYVLHQRGEINLKCRIGSGVTDNRPNRQFVFMKISSLNSAKDEVRCVFDMQDSHSIGLPSALGSVDFYFKRSLEPETFSSLPVDQHKKLVPFGFNYQVLSYSPAFFVKIAVLEYLSRPYVPWRKKNGFHVGNLKDIFEALFFGKKNGLLDSQFLSPQHRLREQNSILFQCRLWDLSEVAKVNEEDTHNVNQMRINLIRRLRREFGASFLGGLQNNQYARLHAPDLISSLPTARRSYLELVNQAGVVVSSSGLLKSNGWKLGEYISLGKAIVSEPINTLLPGGFSAGDNYYDYFDEDGCVERIVKMIDEPEIIGRLEENNSSYYYNYLAPDALMRMHISHAAFGLA